MSPAQDSIAGIGCDVVGLAVLQRQVDSSFGSHFLGNVLTAGEIDRCGRWHAAYAEHWAVKEAIAKAVGCGWTGLRPLQIELTSPDAQEDPRGWIVEATGDYTWPHGAHLWTWQVSTSLSSHHALAFVIATHAARQERENGELQAVTQASTKTATHVQPLPPRERGRPRGPIAEGTSR